ncbi:hypothetical protein [Gordonia polyisoprenivorans]|uniref:hypothetical protein n=1 Tax=Gordonia polyisoprenivorans TaxID=84595 RepID=UPI0010543B02|nr:hypothetical protein [Gordonia polyisoprenivorans]
MTATRGTAERVDELPRKVIRARCVARALAGAAALAAIGACLSSIPSVADARPETSMVETWRLVGFATFAALFVLLAVRPTALLSLWLVLIANKLALTCIAMSFGPDVSGAGDAAIWDGALTLLLVAGFVAAVISRPQGSTIRS